MNDMNFETGVVTATMKVMQAIAESKAANLWVDPAEYVSDIYCLDQAANLLWMVLVQSTRGIDTSKATDATACCQAIGALLQQAYEQIGFDPDRSCINLRAAVVQDHTVGEADT